MFIHLYLPDVSQKVIEVEFKKDAFIKTILVFSLLVLFCGSFASAYTLEWAQDFQGSTLGYAYRPDLISFSNGSFAKNITQYTRTGPTYHLIDNGTYYGKLYQGWSDGYPGAQGSAVGNGSITWNCGNSALLNYDSMCTFTYNISDMATLPNDPITLRWGTWTWPYTDALVSTCNGAYCAAKVGTDSRPDGLYYPFAVTQLSTAALVFNGSYTVYSGVYVPPTPPANVTFFTTEDGTPEKKVTNVSITLSNGQSVITDTNGYGSINVTPVSNDYKFTAYKAGYNSRIGLDLGPYGTLGGTYVLLMDPLGNTTVTTYNLTLDRSQISIGESVSGLLNSSTGNFDSVKSVRYYYQSLSDVPGSSVTDLYETGSTSKTLNYVKNGTTWMGWDDDTGSFSNNIGAAFPTPVTIIPSDTGNLTVGCFVYDLYGDYSNPQARLNVTSTGNQQNVYIYTQDSFTGNFVAPSNIQIKNLITGTWYNTTTNTGSINVKYAAGTTLLMSATATGWTGPAITREVLDGQGSAIFYVIPMYPYASSNTSWTQLYVSVMANSNYQPITGASVRISNVSYLTGSPFDQYGTTSASGIASFNVTNGTLYYITATKTGYQTGQKATVASGATTQTAIQLTLVGATPTATFPPITNYTSTVTIPGGGFATPTTKVPTQVNGTYTGFWAPFYNSFKAMGADEGTLNILLAGIIVLFFAIVASVATGWSPWGFNSGAALGFIFSCAIGIIYPWLIFIGIVWLLLPLVLRRVGE